MKLPFTPSVNKINGNYYLIPCKSGTPYRTIIKCDENTVKIVNMLSTNISESRMLEKAKEIFEDFSVSELLLMIRKVRNTIKSHEFKENVLEVIEI